MSTTLQRPSMASTNTPTRRSARWVRWVLPIGFWLLIGLLFASQTFFSDWEAASTQWVRLLGFQLLHWGAWALITIGIFWLIRRLPLERPPHPPAAPRRRASARWMRWLFVHGLGSLSVALVHVAFSAFVILILQPFPEETNGFASIFLNMLSFFLLLNVIIYWAVLGTGYAFDFYRKYQHGKVQLAQAQLQALKAQLHPHFLFNTLNAIATLVRQQENKAATDMLVGLSDLLRLSLDDSDAQEIPLEQELEFLERYLAIEKVRFKDRLCIDLQIAPEALRAQVPNLILQPLVENAIRHGIASRAAAGRIAITAACDEGQLRLRVQDDGPGFLEGTPTARGVGLSNTLARLEHLYGPAPYLAYHNAQEGGAVVTLTLPFHAS